MRRLSRFLPRKINFISFCLFLIVPQLMSCAGDEKQTVTSSTVGGVDLTGTYKEIRVDCYTFPGYQLKDSAIVAYSDLYQISGNKVVVSASSPGCQVIWRGTYVFTAAHRLNYKYTAEEVSGGSCNLSAAFNQELAHNITPGSATSTVTVGDSHTNGENMQGIWIRNTVEDTIGIYSTHETEIDTTAKCFMILKRQ